MEYAAARQAVAVVRGIRAFSDYEYELQMALMNRRLEPRIETVFMMPAEAYSYVSSRLVKEVAQLGGSIKGSSAASGRSTHAREVRAPLKPARKRTRARCYNPATSAKLKAAWATMTRAGSNN